MARGIYFQNIGDSATYTDAGGLFTYASQDFVLCGWHRIHGPLGAENFLQNFHGIGFGKSASQTYRGGNFCCDADPRTSPFAMVTYSVGNAGGSFTETVTNFATGEDWFEAIVFNHSTQLFTYYWAKDGAGSLSSVSNTQTTFDNPMTVIVLGGSLNSGSNQVPESEITNVKAWVGASIASNFDATALFNEMNSETPVTTGAGITNYAWWKLANSTDLADSSGNGRTLTGNGSLQNGSMDPVDLQTPPPSRTVITGLRITH